MYLMSVVKEDVVGQWYCAVFQNNKKTMMSVGRAKRRFLSLIA